jgi:hypothetical protein
MNRHIARRFDSESHFVSADFDDRDHDLLVNHDAFVRSSRKNQHGNTPFMGVGQSDWSNGFPEAPPLAFSWPIFRANHATCAGAVFNHHRLAQNIARRFCDDAPDNVIGTARGEGHHQPHRA